MAKNLQIFTYAVDADHMTWDALARGDPPKASANFSRLWPMGALGNSWEVLILNYECEISSIKIKNIQEWFVRSVMTFYQFLRCVSPIPISRSLWCKEIKFAALLWWRCHRVIPIASPVVSPPFDQLHSGYILNFLHTTCGNRYLLCLNLYVWFFLVYFS